MGSYKNPITIELSLAIVQMVDPKSFYSMALATCPGTLKPALFPIRFLFFTDTLFSLSDDTVTYDPMSFVKCQVLSFEYYDIFASDFPPSLISG